MDQARASPLPHTWKGCNVTQNPAPVVSTIRPDQVDTAVELFGAQLKFKVICRWLRFINVMVSCRTPARASAANLFVAVVRVSALGQRLLIRVILASVVKSFGFTARNPPRVQKQKRGLEQEATEKTE